jgi:HAD superfamily hydrolase (TIGR01509 family)
VARTVKLPRLIIFDHDGLMVNSEDLVYLAERELFAPYAERFTWDYYLTSVGMPVADSMAMFLAALPLPGSYAEIMARRNALVRAYLAERVELMPGLLDLLATLRAREVRGAIATSATHAHLGHTLERFALAGDFETTVCIEDVARGKPHPDLILEVLRRTGVPPDDALMLEDAPLGVEAARRAGVACIAVPTRGLAASLFPSAIAILPDLHAVRDMLVG